MWRSWLAAVVWRQGACVVFLWTAIPWTAESQSRPRSPEATGFHGISYTSNAALIPDGNGGFTSVVDGFPTVSTVRPCSPAHRAGIEPGDEIVESNGRDMSDLEAGPLFDEIVPGAAYRLVLKRGEETEVLEVDLVMAERLQDTPDVSTAPVGSLEQWGCPSP